MAQGDRERAMGLPISPMCDRENNYPGKSNLGFFDFVVMPMYTTLAKIVRPSCMELVQKQLQHNYEIWKAQAEEEKRQQAAKEAAKGKAGEDELEAEEDADGEHAAVAQLMENKLHQAEEEEGGGQEGLEGEGAGGEEEEGRLAKKGKKKRRRKKTTTGLSVTACFGGGQHR